MTKQQTSETPKPEVQPQVSINSVPTVQTQQPVSEPEPQMTEKTFTQADLDRIVKERLDREKSKYAGFDEYKRAADKLKEIEDAQKSELDKLQERVTQFEQQAIQTTAENKRLKLNARIATIAGQLGAMDPNDPNFLMATQAIDPDGDGADEQIKISIEALKAQRPYLFGKAQPHLESFNPEGGPGKRGESDAERRARIYGSGGDIFDTGIAKTRGGGVIFPPGWKNEPLGG